MIADLNFPFLVFVHVAAAVADGLGITTARNGRSAVAGTTDNRVNLLLYFAGGGVLARTPLEQIKMNIRFSEAAARRS